MSPWTGSSWRETDSNQREPGVRQSVRISVNQQRVNVLFLSSANSARSVMAEAILNRIGAQRFRAFSAGSHPSGRVNPLALEQLKIRGYATDSLASTSWSDFASIDAPPLRLVICVCGKVTNERHPAWPGEPVKVYWNLRSPNTVQGSDAEVRAAFSSVCAQLEAAMDALVALNFDLLDVDAVAALLEHIGPR
jgi:arsenate reductase